MTSYKSSLLIFFVLFFTKFFLMLQLLRPAYPAIHDYKYPMWFQYYYVLVFLVLLLGLHPAVIIMLHEYDVIHEKSLRNNLRRLEFTGAGEEIRTLDPRLGKPVLYH